MTADDPKIDYQKYRKEYDLPAADARVICDKLGYRIERDGAKQYITGINRYGVSNEYLLKHAALEYRRTMDIKKTLAGEFMEYELIGENIKGNVGVSTIDPKRIKPATPSLKVRPNTSPETYLVRTPPAPPEASALAPTPPIAPSADALQLLATALVEAQKASAPADPLLPQKQLLEAEQQGFRITTEQLSQLLGMSKQTISSKKSGFIKLGFRYEKVKEGSSTLWKIHKVD